MSNDKKSKSDKSPTPQKELDSILGNKITVNIPYQHSPNIPTPPEDGIYNMVLLGFTHITDDGTDSKKPWQAIDILMDICSGSSKGYYTYSCRQNNCYMGRYRVFLGRGYPVDDALEKIKKSNNYDTIEQIEIGKTMIVAEITKTQYGYSITQILDSKTECDIEDYDYITAEEYCNLAANDNIQKYITPQKPNSIYGSLLRRTGKC